MQGGRGGEGEGAGEGGRAQGKVDQGRWRWGWEVGGRGWRGRGSHSPLQAQHLLPLVLVVVHLRAVCQPLVPRLWEGGGEGQVVVRVGREPQGRRGLHTEIRGAAGEPGDFAAV